MVISGHFEKEKEDEDSQIHISERSSGKFLRRLYLPENINIDQIKTELKDGILTIKIPKAKEEKEEKKVIKIE